MIQPIALIEGKAVIRRAGASVAFAAVGAALIWTRFAGYGQSLWHDEIYTVQHYISRGPSAAFGHHGTNDHVLFSVLAWLTVYLPGLGDSAYRLWSILPFIAGVVLTVHWLRRRAGDAVALAFALLATASPRLLALSTEARGYGLAFLAMALMTIAGYEAANEPAARWLSLFVAAGVVGCWTLPTFLLPFAGTSAALLRLRDARRPLLGRLMVACLAIAGFYAISLPALIASSGQRFGVQLPWHAPISGSALELSAAFIPAADLRLTGPQPIAVCLVVPLLVAGWRASRRRMTRLDAVTSAPILLTFIVLTAGRFYVEVRFLSFLLVPLFIWAAFGLEASIARPRTPTRFISSTYVGMIVVIAGFISAWAAITDARLPVEANRDAARAVASALEHSRGHLVVNTHAPQDILFYLGSSKGLLTIEPSQLQRFLCSQHKMKLVFVQQPYGVRLASTSCLVKDGATVQVFRQRDRGGRISVWTIPAARPVDSTSGSSSGIRLIRRGS